MNAGALAVLALSVCISTTLEAQVGTGSAEGHITCNDGNVPARKASVALIPLEEILGSRSSTVQAPESTTTDFNGGYAFAGLTAGTYIVQATSDGYADDLKLARAVLERYTPDQQRALLASFPQVTIKPGETAEENVILRRAGAISGHVLFDTGGAAGKTQVIATLVTSSLTGAMAGDDKQKPASFSQGSFTDDRGVYRIAGLQPGSYRLSVGLSEGFFNVHLSGTSVTMSAQRPGIANLTVFAPEALAEADAKLVRVADGDEIADVDITIPSRNLHALGGTVTQNGAPLAGASISVQRDGRAKQGFDAVSDEDGVYRFDLLPPGGYTIRVKYPSGNVGTVTGSPGSAQIHALMTETDLLDANVAVPAQSKGK